MQSCSVSDLKLQNCSLNNKCFALGYLDICPYLIFISLSDIERIMHFYLSRRLAPVLQHRNKSLINTQCP